MSDEQRSQPELRELLSEEQYSDARRSLFAMGFVERSEVVGPGHKSCVLIAPDGYAVRLVYDPRTSEPS